MIQVHGVHFGKLYANPDQGDKETWMITKGILSSWQRPPSLFIRIVSVPKDRKAIDLKAKEDCWLA